MNKPTVHKVFIGKADGSRVEVVIPRTPADIDQQAEIPAFALALLAFSPYDEKTGRVRWSPHARDVLKGLTEQYGEEAVRKQLLGIMIDIEGGFTPNNPIGLLVHRTRTSGTTRTLTI